MVDEMDWAILRELQDNARLSYNEVSRRVHLSPPAVAERARRLEESGVITGYHAHIDPGAVGWVITAFIRLSCYGPRCVLRDPDVRQWPEVQEIHRVTGDVCSILKVVAESMETFEALIDRLGVYGRPSSSMVLSTPLARQGIAANGASGVEAADDGPEATTPGPVSS
ncbi:Lrp/AsnC family transcriptional regulator [Phytoactinopolyspora limicola]|uniref:Lrp/AsnC family transcriptional regulator n=1 Tax=Phytoactinopolyspora limicola TaxID=2715536 RepID=UPI001A9C6E03|nr:Lrp/AsnC family transcriptional regulator [Phytoactinopolyspora limicola]